MKMKYRWPLWLAAVILITGLTLHFFRPVPRADFHRDSILVFLRELHTHLLPPEYSPLPLAVAGIDGDGRRLTLTTALWERWRPSPLVLLRRIEHLDQVLTEDLHVSRNQTLKASLAALPALLPGHDRYGAPVDLRPLVSPHLAGGSLRLHIGSDGDAVTVEYRGVVFNLAPGETRYLQRDTDSGWSALLPGTEQQVLGELLAAGEPLTALVVTNMGRWPEAAITQDGESADGL